MAEVDEENEYRHTCDVKLSKLGLQNDDKFKFVFDFGDDWEFQCRVLRIIDEDTDEAMMIRAVGESPEQYSAYE